MLNQSLNNSRIRWSVFIVIGIAIFAIYSLTSQQHADGRLLMPLDDVYIHFQYARQLADGYPYQYNLVDPPTSGATSLIYPYLLALGYRLGFQSLALGTWAMLLGTLALIIAQWTVYRLVRALESPPWLAMLIAVIFGLSGSIHWHFVSGMETGIVITLTLLTLLAVVEKRLMVFLIVASLLTLIRPEGGLMAAIASATLFLRLWPDYTDPKQPSRLRLLLLVIPIGLVILQPVLNAWITGTTVASGTQAKSILAMVPADRSVIISRIWDNFSRMWLELLTGYDNDEGHGWYLPVLIGLLGLSSIPILMLKQGHRLIGWMLLGWFLMLTLAISTLDNAFWHFKRYQMPMLALLFPLAAWALSAINQHWPAMRRVIIIYCGLILPVVAIALAVQFQSYHALNVSYVYQQPYQMAQWLRDNTPSDAQIAVHDVGLMRYHGERTTLDMVGLTTPRAASYWRNGPGSVVELLLNEQPDYIASYGRGHGYGLAFLADTALYANSLATYSIENWRPAANVALAADTQAIYQPDWDSIANQADLLQQCATSVYAPQNLTESTVSYLNVADIASEIQADYQFSTKNLQGFATEARDFNGVTMGYRLINQSEQFTLSLPPQSTPVDQWMLVTTVHSASAGQIDVFVNDTHVDTQWIPADAGAKHTITTIFEASPSADALTIQIVPTISESFYMPICHVLRPATITTRAADPLATYQEESVQLLGAEFATELPATDSLSLDLLWQVREADSVDGDYRLFAHLYQDTTQPPIAQSDVYLAGMPLGNWQRGVLEATLSLRTVSGESLAVGEYQLAIGFYNPNNPTDRLIPLSESLTVTEDSRLWLGTVKVITP